MKLTKKELTSIANQIIRLKKDSKEQEFREVKLILQIQGIYNKVETEIYKIISCDKFEIKKLSEVEKLIAKAYNNKIEFLIDCVFDEVYKEEIHFFDRLTLEEKQLLKGSLNYLYWNDNNYKFKQLMRN